MIHQLPPVGFFESLRLRKSKKLWVNLAEHDWIINLDDDELPSTSLLNHLCQWKARSKYKSPSDKTVNFVTEVL